MVGLVAIVVVWLAVAAVVGLREAKFNMLEVLVGAEVPVVRAQI